MIQKRIQKYNKLKVFSEIIEQKHEQMNQLISSNMCYQKSVKKSVKREFRKGQSRTSRNKYRIIEIKSKTCSL